MIFLDKIKKLLELGNTPKVIIEIDTLIMVLERQINKKKGKRFKLISPQSTESEVSHSLNEVISFLNERFQI